MHTPVRDSDIDPTFEEVIRLRLLILIEDVHELSLSYVSQEAGHHNSWLTRKLRPTDNRTSLDTADVDAVLKVLRRPPEDVLGPAFRIGDPDLLRWIDHHKDGATVDRADAIFRDGAGAVRRLAAQDLLVVVHGDQLRVTDAGREYMIRPPF